MPKRDENNSRRQLILGCIADDVTGATDLAINVVQGGLCVVQLLGIPTVEELSELDADAVVVGLKTRSVAKDVAVQQSVQCLEAFRAAGVARYFFKYCSTFDSTIEGNIAPVAAALMDELDLRQTIFCPAFPRNGRTVYQGHLFVNGKLLSESGMEKHPLNPMTDANLVRFLGQQTDRKVGLLRFEDIEQGNGGARLRELAEQDRSFVITDACSDKQLEDIARIVAEMPLVTGGSGIGRFLPASYRKMSLVSSPEYSACRPKMLGRSMIVAGSCSVATRKQIAWMEDKVPCRTLDIAAVIERRAETLEELMAWARSTSSESPLLISSTASPELVGRIQDQYGGDIAAKAVEDFLSEATAEIVSELGISRLIVAGGETSGAVVQKLGLRALRIDEEICSGVPWTESLGDRRMALALKSGNFGSDDFFERALNMLP